MSQSVDAFTPVNGPGASVRAEIAADLQALNSCNSGPNAPPSPVPGMFWVDTANKLVKQRDSTNSIWVVRGALDGDVQTDIASASTTDIGSVGSWLVNVTGSNTINLFGASASVTRPFYYVRFSGTLTIANSGSIFLPGGGNITTTPGDYALMQYLGSGTWRMIAYYQIAASSLAGLQPHGQCQLRWASATQASLIAVDGNCLRINGRTCTIPPAGGVLMTAPGLAARTAYYVYASDTNGDGVVDTLECSQTGFAVDTAVGNIGVAYKSTDRTRTLVGMAYTSQSGTFLNTQPDGDGTVIASIASYFNRRQMPVQVGISASTSSTSYVALGAAVIVHSWESATISTDGNMANNGSAPDTSVSAIFVDGVASVSSAVSLTNGYTGPLAVHGEYNFSATFHTYQIRGFSVTGNLFTWAGFIYVTSRY